jgi:hypothetical protein
MARRGLTVATTLAAVLAASWLVLRPWTQRTNHMLLAVESLTPATEVLVLGTSHVDCAIDPRGVDAPLVNLSGIATNYVCLEGVCRAHLDGLSDLRLVVIEADIFPLRYDTLAALQGDYTRLLDLAPLISALEVGWREKLKLWKGRQLLYGAATAPFMARDKFAPQVVLTRLQRRSFKPAIDVCGTGEAEISAGFRAFEQVMSSENDGSVKVATHENESSKNVAANVAANTEALTRIIQFVLDRGLTVVLLRLPHHATYREARPAEMNQQYDEAIQAIETRFAPMIADERLQIWEMEAAKKLTDQDYYDGDHLNRSGAQKFTRQFNERLNAALGREARKP